MKASSKYNGLSELYMWIMIACRMPAIVCWAYSFRNVMNGIRAWWHYQDASITSPFGLAVAGAAFWALSVWFSELSDECMTKASAAHREELQLKPIQRTDD